MTQEHIGIAFQVVKFGDGAVVTTKAGQSEGIAMHKSLSLLAVALRSKGVDAVGNKLEEGFERTVVSHVLLQQAEFVLVGVKMVVAIIVEKIGIYLFADNLIGNDKLGLSTIEAANGHHAEVVEQTEKVVIVGNVFGGETFLQFSRNKSFRNQGLDNGGIVGKLLILADEHTQLVVVNADILLKHLLRQLASFIYIFIKER